MAEPFSDEEIRKISDPEWNWQWEGYLELHSGSSRIMKGVKNIGNRFLDTITADRMVIKHWQNRFDKAEKRIEELTKQAEIKDSLAEGVMTLAEVYEQLQDAKVEIKRLRDQLSGLKAAFDQSAFTEDGITMFSKAWVDAAIINIRQALDAGKEKK